MNLPEVGKCSAGQKLVFWSMSFLIIVLITSGIVIWEQYFSEYFSSHAEADCRADTLDCGYHGDMCMDRACLCGDLGSGHNQRHDPRPGDRRLGVAASSPLAEGIGDREALGLNRNRYGAGRHTTWPGGFVR
jgi:hypothetical protein